MNRIEESGHDSKSRATRGLDPRPFRRRTVGMAMILWTASVVAGLAYVAGTAAIPSVGLTLAVGGLFAVVWLFVMVILVLFLAVR
ncbi:MAG: hypothetical protein HYX55_00005 [Chloroflexi bacterium]|nr:hypothetical protein [Chloroflexota bacterium]